MGEKVLICASHQLKTAFGLAPFVLGRDRLDELKALHQAELSDNSREELGRLVHILETTGRLEVVELYSESWSCPEDAEYGVRWTFKADANGYQVFRDGVVFHQKLEDWTAGRDTAASKAAHQAEAEALCRDLRARPGNGTAPPV